MELMKPSKSLTSSSSFSIFSSISHSSTGNRHRFSSSSCKGMVAKVSCNLPSSSVSSSAAGSGKLVASQQSYFFGDTWSRLLKKTTGKVLEASDDEYGGIIVDPHRLPHNPDAFASMLRSSLSHWRTKGKKGIWLKLPLERSQLVPIAVQEGFEYHHAEPGYVMLTYWIPEQPCMLPSNASHHVGVGGFVVNENNEILVVQEKFCTPSFSGVWKIPTGFIHEAEEIYSGAIREVKEETGIDTEFVEVMAFRHAHNLAFQKSDLFFVCMLEPLSTEISIDDYEIQAARWMPLGDFLEQPLINGDGMFKKILDICIARLGKRYCGLSAHQVVSKFDDRQSCLYYNVVDAGNCIGY
ncbi:Nudix hydrolase 8 [Linum grandiflorum]